MKGGKEFPGQEDFGWYVNFETGCTRYCMVVGSRSGDGGQLERVVWIERSCGLIGSLLGGRKKNIPQEVPDLVHKVWSSSDAIRDIRWHLQKDFDAGKEEKVSEKP